MNSNIKNKTFLFRASYYNIISSIDNIEQENYLFKVITEYALSYEPSESCEDYKKYYNKLTEHNKKLTNVILDSIKADLDRFKRNK